MTFLQPILLLGLLGAAVPLLIHLFGRPRARLLRFPAVELIERAISDPAPRRRLRERLLLAARIAAAALLALVLARPARWAAGAPGEGARRVAVVLDDSFSMRLEHGGATSFEEGVEAARAAIEAALDAGGEAALLLGARGGVDPAADVSADRARLLAALHDARPSARTTDLVGAVARARGALGGSGRVVVITDGTAPIPREDDLDVVDVAAGATLDNVALVGVTTRPAGDVPGTIQIEAEVANFGDRPRTVTVTLSAGTRTLSRAGVTLAPRARQTRRLSARLPTGALTAEVAIEADRLAIDDVWHLAVEGTQEIRVLAVNGDPRATRGEDELFYLRTALEAAADPPVRLRTAAPEETAARLVGQDVVLLCNVRALPATDSAALGTFVRNGGGLLVTAGNQIDPDAPLPLADLLPGGVAAVWSAGPAGAAEDANRMQRIGATDIEHVALAPFAAQPDALRSARFWSRLILRAPAQADRRVPLRFEDGAPALLERDVGKGRTLQWASTIDRDWSDWVIRPAFAPMIRQMVRRLVRGLSTVAMDVHVGEPCALPEGARGEVLVSRPDGREDRVDAAYAGTDVPGVYRLTAKDGAETACAVHLDPRESELRRVARPPPPTKAAGTAPRSAVPMSHAFAAVLLGLLLAESLLTRRR